MPLVIRGLQPHMYIRTVVAVRTQRSYPYRKYYWFVPGAITGRLRRTKYRMTEQEAMRWPGATKDFFESVLVESPGDEDKRDE